MTKLGSTGLKKVAEEIKKLDPEGKYVVLDPVASTVRYSPEITHHEIISTYHGEEEPTRAFVVCWLCTIGGYLPSNIELRNGIL